MKLYPRTNGGRLLFLAILFAVLTCGYFSFIWVTYNVPFVQFRAACRDFFRNAPLGTDDLSLVSGELTQEFWDTLIVGYGNRLEALIRANLLTVKDKKLYVTLSFYIPLPKTAAKFEGEFEEVAYRATADTAYEILQRRRNDGADFSDFRANFGTYGRKLGEPELMKSGECGFVEELILKGGRFAQDSSE
ncbi:hypothetical protein [Hwanghaeella sp. LZ110]|uniref:hypothetical protein n=1 Tax=Hwanghaeella sp. LZ110 TaxID=3402810 RepID=UPI003B673E0B